MVIGRKSKQLSGSRHLGILAGLAFGWLTVKKPAITPGDIRKQDFSTSSQKMGLSFNDRLRAIFRFRWLKKIK